MEIITKEYKINRDREILFHNRADYCVGTGRMGLALQEAYQKQLELVQKHIGFSHIRGHGLFSDDMAIYQEYEDESGERKTEYNFTYLDMVMDRYLEKGLRPFLELGFMPEKMASGSQTVFYWKGNVTPPRSYQDWRMLVQVTLRHLMERYGEEEVTSWPVEVWNEPNLSGFWENADMEEYFRLFYETFQAVKMTDERFKVGGPAICGVDDQVWLRKFLEFCEEKKVVPDFITRHHYMFDKPEMKGHYSYGKLRNPQTAMEELEVSENIIKSFPAYSHLPMHITEFNTSYSPDSPVHDTIVNAAYVAGLLAKMGDTCESYSYWTFGDIFEEKGVAFTPFHGGFGLVANGLIPKPTFWTFAFFKKLQGKCIHRSDELLVMEKSQESYCGAAWNLCLDEEKVLKIDMEIPARDGKEYCLLTKTVDQNHGNPLQVWHDLGEPPYPSKEQAELLQECARPWVQSRVISSHGDSLSVQLTLEPSAVVYFELTEVHLNSDRGYQYNYKI